MRILSILLSFGLTIVIFIGIISAGYALIQLLILLAVRKYLSFEDYLDSIDFYRWMLKAQIAMLYLVLLLGLFSLIFNNTSALIALLAITIVVIGLVAEYINVRILNNLKVKHDDERISHTYQ